MVNIDAVKGRLDSDGYEYNDLAIFYKLYAEKKWARGQFSKYRKYSEKSGLLTWFDIHEPYRPDDPENEWLNGWSNTAKHFTEDELIIAIKNYEKQQKIKL